MKQCLIHNIDAIVVSFLSIFVLASCENPNLPGYDSDDESGNTTSNVVADDPDAVTLTLQVSGYEQVAFEESDGDASYSKSQKAVALADVCTRIAFAAYIDDERQAYVTQTSDDSDFGTFSVTLSKGTYTVVVLAHNGTGNATMTSPDAIKFTNNKVTDTFYYCEELTIDDDASFAVTLERAVAKFRLCLTDVTPEEVTMMQLYYTGGSSTFDATTGYGCVSSRQTEQRDVDATAYTGGSQYDIYTFPHDYYDELTITVTAHDADDNILKEKVFETVPVAVNYMTVYTGEFFGDDVDYTGSAFSVSVGDTAWTVREYEY